MNFMYKLRDKVSEGKYQKNCYYKDFHEQSTELSAPQFGTRKEIELFHMVSIIFSFRSVRNRATNIASCQAAFQEQMTAKSQEEATNKNKKVPHYNFFKLSQIV